MDLLTGIVYRALGGHLRSIDDFMRHPVQRQEKTLLSLVRRSRDTIWGRKHDYAHIHSISDFTSKVDVQDYESLKDWINRARLGQENVLWRGRTSKFAKSSGTTQDKSKFIPVTDEYLRGCHLRAFHDCCAVYLSNNPASRLFSGKSFALGGSQTFEKDSNVLVGDLSACLISRQPRWLNHFRTPPPESVLVPEWDEKLRLCTPIALRSNTTSMAGVPSWLLIFLKHLLGVSGKKDITEIWPSLEVFFHGGISFTHYRKQFEELIPSGNMHYMETYNASEGFFALQNQPGDNSMLLMLDLDIFYEFIPLSDYHLGKMDAIPLADVKTGVNYVMLISGSNGLWRYVIGDTVTFTSTCPYKILITGRTRQFINGFGEEVILDNTDKAVHRACSLTDSSIYSYMVAPIYIGSSNGAHEWAIEFEREPKDLHLFGQILDSELCSLNSDYEAKRAHDITLGAPVIHSVPKGTFNRWMDKRGKMGGQNKVPQLNNERRFLEEILKICTSQSQEI